MIEFLQKGGPLMGLLLAASVLAAAVFVERLLYLRRVEVPVDDFLRGLANLVRRGQLGEAQLECRGLAVPVARVVHAAILRHDQPRADLKEIVQEAGQLEVPRLERHLDLLAMIAQTAPLVGLLGTVTGMIRAFMAVNAGGGNVSAGALSAGIYTSLLTTAAGLLNDASGETCSTAAGLVVAIPAGVVHSYLSARVDRLLRELERAGIEIVNVLMDHRPAVPAPGIIPFDRETAARPKVEGRR